MNFLLATWEGGGNVPPVLTLAAELVGRGHRVRIASDLANGADARATGARFVPWTTAPSRHNRHNRAEDLRDWEATSAEEGFGALLDAVMTAPALRYARDLLAELAREPADLVVSSDMLFGVMAACESTGQRLALLGANLCLYPLPGMPTFGAGLPPARNTLEQEQHEAARQGMKDLLDRGLVQLNAARAALGLSPLAHTMDQLEAAQAMLLGTSRAFDFPVEALPPKVRYIGPLLREPGWVAPWSPPWIASDRRPLLAVAFSTTFQNHAGAVQAVIDAAAQLPVRALVTLGPLQPDELRAADNVWLVPSAPHDALMREASIVVTHGGHGTVMRALSHRRPLLVIPHGRDQNDNAMRIVEHGAGLVLPPMAGTHEIRNALQRLLDEPSFSQAARRLGEAIASEAREVSAVAEVEAIAGGR